MSESGSPSGPRLGFLVSRRWILFFLAVVVIAVGTWWLGQWQFGRLADRKADNAIVRANEQRTATPIEQVLTPGSAAPTKDEWLLVTATGTYSPRGITLRYRSSDDYDVAGVDAVVPLITANGTAVVVDRGFVPNNADGSAPTIPAPPSGTVTVEGYLRMNGTGRSTAVDADLNTRSLSSTTAGEATGLPTYGGWLQLKSEDPAPADAPATYDLPDLGNGPHFFYGIQWWFFGLLAIVGFGYLAWDEYVLSGRRRAEGLGAPGVNEDGVPIEPAITPKKQRANAKADKKKALKAAYEAAYAKEAAERARRG